MHRCNWVLPQLAVKIPRPAVLKIDVPPTLVSFAVTTAGSYQILQNAFTAPGHRVILLMPAYDEQHLPQTSSLIALYDQVSDLIARRCSGGLYTHLRRGR